MERFEIEDIVAQDAKGVVFHGRMIDSGDLVAIRRFFPFGKDGEGLEKEEGIAFSIAASRLATVSHPALRRVIEGSVDPIDGMPYLVSEWIQGQTLPDVLGHEYLDPALVNDVMRLALEVSLVLSNILGEEALWIETTPESILVGDTESGRGFTFWISPFKWLGSDTQQRNLSDLVILGESLAGWSNKFVGDQAGNGLGGWFKWLKANPDTGLREAMEHLAESTGSEPPPSDEVLVNAATVKPAVLVKQPSSKAPLLALGALSLLVLFVALAYLHKTAKAPVIEEEFATQEISEVIIASQNYTTTEPADLEKSADIESPETPPEVAANPETEDLETSATEETAAHEAQPTVTALSPDNIEEIDKLDIGTEVTLTGIFRATGSSRSGKSIYLEFESEERDPIRGVIQENSYEDEYSEKSFTPMIGKNITLRGTVLRFSFGNSSLVRIRSMQDISVVP